MCMGISFLVLIPTYIGVFVFENKCSINDIFFLFVTGLGKNVRLQQFLCFYLLIISYF